MKSKDFNGKVVLITGAGTGIGRALARNLLREGARVVLTGRRRSKLEETILTESNAPNASIIIADVSKYGDLCLLIQTILEKHGRVDVLINNAGTAYGGAVTDVHPEEVEYLAKLNLVAPIWLTQLVFPVMKRQGEGIIINLCSVAGVVPVPNQSFYCATKHGIHGFSLSLRRELLGSSIDVITVYPGGVKSELMSDNVQKAMRESNMRMVSLMKAEEAARIIVSGMKRRQSTIYVTSARERQLIRLNRIFPGLVDRKMKNIRGTIGKILATATTEVRERTALAKLVE